MNDIALTVANLMALAASTAPKACGQDCISVKVITGDQLNLLADEMVKYSSESEKKFFGRDGENIRRSEAIVLISIKDYQKAGLNCGACGHDKCDRLSEHAGVEFPGPLCAWRLVDIGIAVGSAVKTASILNADNRVMYSVGVVARKIGLVESPFVIGIPISAHSKNIYFDRPVYEANS